MKKLFIVVNVDWFFLSHRKNIAIAAKNAGYDVTVITNFTGHQSDIERLGLKAINLTLSRTGKSVLEAAKVLFFLSRLYKKEKPDIVHHVGMKVMLFGTLAARLTKTRNIVNAISGTGMLFSSNSISAKIVLFFLKQTNCNTYKYIFQNLDDRTAFEKNRISLPEQAVMIKGSGVNLNEYKYVSEHEKDNSVIKIVFTGRMLESKGVLILVEAARSLKQQYIGRIQFLLCGALDENPESLTLSDMNSMCDGNYIKWLGFQKDIYSVLKACHIMCFPSFYMEGLPKSVIDAEASGLPVITTDWVGCRDTVDNGYNGFIVPPKNSKELADKIAILVENTELRQQMGRNARIFAEKNFSIEQVINAHLETYSSLKN